MPVYRLTCADRRAGVESQRLLQADSEAAAQKLASDLGYAVVGMCEATDLDLSDPICKWIGCRHKVASRNSPSSAQPSTSQPVTPPRGATAVVRKVGHALRLFLLILACALPPALLLTGGIGWLRGDFSNSYQSERPSDIPMIGQQGYVWTQGKPEVLAATSMDSHDALVEARVAGDDVGIKQLLAGGRAVPLSDGTRVRVLKGEGWIGPLKLRVVEGAYAGQVVWLDATYLRE